VGKGLAGDLLGGGLGAAEDLAGLGDALATDAAGAGVELPGAAGGAATVEQAELRGFGVLTSGAGRLVGGHVGSKPGGCDT
jgi:hypothetical protein